jgi:hypothetical protein
MPLKRLELLQKVLQKCNEPLYAVTANKRSLAASTSSKRRKIESCHLPENAGLQSNQALECPCVVSPEPQLEKLMSILTTRQVAEKYQAALGSKTVNAAYTKLARMRIDGTGPEFIRPTLGSPVTYREGEVEKWLESRTFRSTSEARAVLRGGDSD